MGGANLEIVVVGAKREGVETVWEVPKAKAKVKTQSSARTLSCGNYAKWRRKSKCEAKPRVGSLNLSGQAKHLG